MDNFIEVLPKLNDGEFLINVKLKESDVMFCVKELEWHVAMDIQAASFNHSENHLYYAEDYEKRETLSQAIVWAADIIQSQLVENTDNSILSQLEYTIVEKLWTQYSEHITISAEEIAALFNSAKLYFSGNADRHPVPSLIKEVDMFCKGIASMSRKELREITNSDMERITVITSAREEVLGAK